MSNKIKIISIYYGSLPEWFRLWLTSCAKNPSYDFLLITDQNYENDIAENVEIKNISWGELKERFENALGIKISLDKPYKICDFRPIFGLAFADEVMGYDFWGHCDLDMIWGNLSDFVSENDFAQYDRIGLYGAFTIYRNNEKMNQLYKMKGASFSWKSVFTRAESFIFDEMPGMNCICLQNMINWKTDIKIADIDTYLSRYSSDLHICHETFTWEDGVAKHYYLTDGKVISENVAYIHFSGKKPELSAQNLKRVVFNHNNIVELNNSITTPNELSMYSGFISAENDKKQRYTYRILKCKKFIRSTFKQKVVRLVNQLYIKKFYSKVKR